MINYIDAQQIENDIRKIFIKEKPLVKKGLYISFDYSTKKWIAIDNTDSDYYVEEFERIDDAINWLRKYDKTISVFNK